MQLHHALIVDDSRTASTLLRHMLDRHDISSDAVLSAEDGIDYLDSSQPDVIFMDHMMPGMDGFQAVKLIKSRSDLSTIPIVMYTTQASEVYNGQARALGAVSVLGKPATEEDVIDVLARLALEGQPLTVEVPVLSDEIMGELEDLPVQATEADKQAPLTSAEVEADTATKAAPKPISFQSALTPTPARPWLGFIGLLILAVLAYLAWQGPRPLPVNNQLQLVNAVSGLANQAGGYAFGRQPFDDARLQLVREVEHILVAQGIAATIELRAHVGEFCRVYDAGGQDSLPGRGVPIEQCDVIGYEKSEAQLLAEGQSLSFRRYVESRNRGSGPLRIRIVALGTSVPLRSYPAVDQVELAEDWNSVAATNNRVELVIYPRESGQEGR